MIFYGLAYSVQELGLKSINYNGIFFGITQAVGYLVMIPFIHKMPRKFWTIIFQILTLFGIGILAYLSHFEDSEKIRIMRAAVSTLILTVINSAQFPIFFAGLSEMFPSKLRGVSNALILFLCKMTGSFSPYLSTLAKNNGYHIMVGCCLFTIISLPLTFLQTETLKEKSDLDDSDAEEDESGFPDDGDDSYTNADNGDQRTSLFGSLVSGNDADFKFNAEKVKDG